LENVPSDDRVERWRRGLLGALKLSYKEKVP